MSPEFWAIITSIGMLLALSISLVPFIPGPAAVWAIGIIYAVATGFEYAGIGTSVIITVFMIVGSTADWWTRYFGLNAEGEMSCAAFAVSVLGGILGTFFIPIPILGTVLGAMLGVAFLVILRAGTINEALRAARGVFSGWLASFFVEILTSIAIVTVFVRALLTAFAV